MELSSSIEYHGRTSKLKRYSFNFIEEYTEFLKNIMHLIAYLTTSIVFFLIVKLFGYIFTVNEDPRAAG